MEYLLTDTQVSQYTLTKNPIHLERDFFIAKLQYTLFFVIFHSFRH